jgi:MoaA/NifB/PqqE/SkfB family radical SAM enzyme
VHCDIWKNRGREDSPSAEQWQDVLGDLRNWLGPVQVVLTGGESLLKSFTIDLVRFGSSLGLFIELLTHGYWEDQDRIRDLALAGPSRVTISLDGIGETHSLVRGREGFFEKTERSILTLRELRKKHHLDLAVRLKTVIMRQNLEGVADVARYAQQKGLEVFYQPIEQNYNTQEDPHWFRHSETWPTDTSLAEAVVEELQQLKAQGLPIVNSNLQLQAMVRYFRNPAENRIAVQSHSAHEKQLLCSALTTLQLQANGDVTVCISRPPIGNIKSQSIRTIWQERPQWWSGDCCLAERLAPVEEESAPKRVD